MSHPNHWRTGPIVLLAMTLILVSASAFGNDVVTLFDFREGDHGWTGNPRIANINVTDEGLSFESTGTDPWIEGPRVKNMPQGERVRITLRMKSTGDARGEIYYGPTFTAERQAPFFVQPDGEWHEYTVLLPPQEADTRLRVDPAGETGAFTLAWIKAEAIRPLVAPEFVAPVPVAFTDVHELTSGALSFVHNGVDWEGYALRVDGHTMAMGHTDSMLGVVIDGAPVMVALREASGLLFDVSEDEKRMTITAHLQDTGGATWSLTRIIEAHPHDGTLRMRIRIETDTDRELFHLPWVTLFPGLGGFGEEKTQALLPGVEYLENEPSSSEADFNREQADRRIVEDHKLTLPMMALQHDGRYIGLLWNRTDKPAAVFDSPDRVFNSGAHLMGLWYPGVGDLRLENEFSVFGLFPIAKDVPLELEVHLLGGLGDSIVPAAQHVVALRGLPELPRFEGGFDHAVRLLAAGWLDSDLHEDGLWRHAVWGDSFGPQPAADAAAYMQWLAAHSSDPALAERLQAAAQRGLERLTPPDHYTVGVSHVSHPAPVLVYGALENNIARLVDGARAGLAQFDETGLRRYQQPDPNRPDYGRTHFADHANGYNAQALEPILKAAAFSGDAALTESALDLLDKQTTHYENTVPRGAQTWEMPLHTPDILGSARLIRCYVLGYLLSGNEAYIDQARYWAWTGVPLIYLDHPVDGPVGSYATIAVLGATNWVAPNWVGLPVQWCGLVYRSALHDLARCDPKEGPFWDLLAKGITLSGLEQTFPLDDEARQGLLPDFFHLREQISDGPAITPGTIQAHLAETYGKTAYYSMERINDDNALVHVPGTIKNYGSDGDGISLSIQGWAATPFWVRVTRADSEVQATWNDAAPLKSEYDASFGALNILLEGEGTLKLIGLQDGKK